MQAKKLIALATAVLFILLPVRPIPQAYAETGEFTQSAPGEAPKSEAVFVPGQSPEATAPAETAGNTSLGFLSGESYSPLSAGSATAPEPAAEPAAQEATVNQADAAQAYNYVSTPDSMMYNSPEPIRSVNSSSVVWVSASQAAISAQVSAQPGDRVVFQWWQNGQERQYFGFSSADMTSSDGLTYTATISGLLEKTLYNFTVNVFTGSGEQKAQGQESSFETLSVATYAPSTNDTAPASAPIDSTTELTTTTTSTDPAADAQATTALADLTAYGGTSGTETTTATDVVAAQTAADAAATTSDSPTTTDSTTTTEPTSSTTPSLSGPEVGTESQTGGENGGILGDGGPRYQDEDQYDPVTDEFFVVTYDTYTGKIYHVIYYAKGDDLLPTGLIDENGTMWPYSHTTLDGRDVFFPPEELAPEATTCDDPTNPACPNAEEEARRAEKEADATATGDSESGLNKSEGPYIPGTPAAINGIIYKVGPDGYPDFSQPIGYSQPIGSDSGNNDDLTMTDPTTTTPDPAKVAADQAAVDAALA